MSNVSFDNSLWHLCLGHMSGKGLDILSKQDLLGNHKVKPLQLCEHWVFRNHHRMKFPKAMHTTKAILDYVHSDCWDL